MSFLLLQQSTPHISKTMPCSQAQMLPVVWSMMCLNCINHVSDCHRFPVCRSPDQMSARLAASAEKPLTLNQAITQASGGETLIRGFIFFSVMHLLWHPKITLQSVFTHIPTSSFQRHETPEQPEPQARSHFLAVGRFWVLCIHVSCSSALTAGLIIVN